MNKVAALLFSAAIMTAASLTTPIPAHASDYYLTVHGNVVLSGGNGSPEDVNITIQYQNNNPLPGYENYENPSRWYGSPNADGSFTIPTKAYKNGQHMLKVTATLDGYQSDYDVLTFGRDSTEKLILVADNTSNTMSIGGTFYLDGAPYKTSGQCPTATVTQNGAIGSHVLQACNGAWQCNAISGLDMTVVPSLEGFTFSPESITISSITDERYDLDFTMTPVTVTDGGNEEAANAETEAPVQEESTANTVKLYFMTGSSIDDPGEVFAEFDVPKNARGNTVNLAKTVNTLGKRPEKDGLTFTHWVERSLKDSSKMGNKISGPIWTNGTDQYIYAQYKANVKLYFMTGSSIDDPGEVFAEFDVPKNARGNTVTLAKTIKTLNSLPEKEGAKFSHWVERSLKDPTKMGNKISGPIWINNTDQYIYAQYK